MEEGHGHDHEILKIYLVNTAEYKG